MAVGRDTLIVAVLIFNVLFPTFAYAFTTLAVDGDGEIDSVIDPDELLLAGIDIENATTHTVIHGAAWTEFEVGSETFRVQWVEDQGLGWLFDNSPGFALQRRANPIDRMFNTWLFPLNIRWVNPSNGTALDVLSNATLVDAYEESKGWAKIDLKNDVRIVLFTANSTISPTFEDAVEVNGTVLVTIATPAMDDFSLLGFIDFFTGTLIGDNMYGLPSVFSWIMRLLSVVSILALAWFVKDMTQI